jgi:hypothetical protein
MKSIFVTFLLFVPISALIEWPFENFDGSANFMKLKVGTPGKFQ